VSGPRRILHVISGLGTGGAEAALLRLVSHLDRAHFANTILTLRDGPMKSRFLDAGIDVIDARLSGIAGLPRAWSAIASSARALRPHLVHGWMNHGNLGAWLAHRALDRAPRLVWGIRQSLYDFKHEKPATRVVIRAEAALSRTPDIILFNSAIAREQHRTHGFDNPRMEIIPNGFDTALLKPDFAARRDTRAHLGVPEDAMLVGLVARYHAVKDFPVFFRAMSKVLGSRRDVWALAIGTDVRRAAGADLRRCVPPELASRIVLRDETSTVERIFPALDVLCSTSIGEGFPNVVAEAMSCEVPCVVTDAGDSAAVVGETGRVVPRGDAAACAAAVSEMLANPVALALDARRARERIVEHYSIAAITARYAHLYESLMEHDESK
jgi:glycosyltransferase involved in cell wall biosynthesis